MLQSVAMKIRIKQKKTFPVVRYDMQSKLTKPVCKTTESLESLKHWYRSATQALVWIIETEVFKVVRSYFHIIKPFS